jgi:hypothetical protein
MACSMGHDVCQESNPLEKSKQFTMFLEQWMMKVNELHLCLICMKHLVDRECYHKVKTEYRGYSESGCGMYHHLLLHWALIVARLVQGQVAPESYPAEMQQSSSGSGW